MGIIKRSSATSLIGWLILAVVMLSAISVTAYAMTRSGAAIARRYLQCSNRAKRRQGFPSKAQSFYVEDISRRQFRGGVALDA